MKAKSQPETSDNARKNIRQKQKAKNQKAKKKNSNKWTQMNCLNY